MSPVRKLRLWLDAYVFTDQETAQLVFRLIPATCPFARRVRIFHKVIVIPPLCKFNPVYEQLVHLRIRAMAYLDPDH
ncbi:MAG: nitrogenase, partial [Anaerolineae bacterium]|nr:nitrogenase [Gloeobacterales cyanobacterium ES-bin-313]